jgi:hypothetical protein
VKQGEAKLAVRYPAPRRAEDLNANFPLQGLFELLALRLME